MTNDAFTPRGDQSDLTFQLEIERQKAFFFLVCYLGPFVEGELDPLPVDLDLGAPRSDPEDGDLCQGHLSLTRRGHQGLAVPRVLDLGLALRVSPAPEGHVVKLTSEPAVTFEVVRGHVGVDVDGVAVIPEELAVGLPAGVEVDLQIEGMFPAVFFFGKRGWKIGY